MSPTDVPQKRHLFPKGFASKTEYVYGSGTWSSRSIPSQDRIPHAQSLRAQLQVIQHDIVAARSAQENAGLSRDFGLQIKFESFPDIGWALAEHSFDRRTGIELLNTRDEGNVTYATVFVPDGKLSFFEKKIQDYVDYKTDSRGRPRDNQKFVDTIKSIRTATLRELWTDSPDEYPSDPDERCWWEVWLPVRDSATRIFRTFTDQARSQGIEALDYCITFPERTVTVVNATRTQMEASLMLLNTVAELRRAKDTADFFVDSSPIEQSAWKDDLLARTHIAAPQAHTAYVCILDTGVNRGHPLLAEVLATRDMDTIEPDWGVDDKEGHGTNMAGLVIWGNLYDAVLATHDFTIYHRLESVKLLARNHENKGNSHFHGLLTSEAVSRAAILSPDRNRVFQLAITADDDRDRGRPSAWSSMIDALSFSDEPRNSQLFVVSAGNIETMDQWRTYPASNKEAGIQDPAQAWNALTVGAYTEMDYIDESDADGYTPIAGPGELSPYSRTSACWDSQWPIKPDVVMEGGNVASNAFGPVSSSSLSLLTTHHRPVEKMFITANATSAASALVARLAAQIMTMYPALNPVTVRGMIVHSARWTDAMKSQFFWNRQTPKKADYANLVRHCGFGVPDHNRALWSLSNSLTLIIEDSFQPFFKDSSKKSARYHEMNFYELPWPTQALRDLGSLPIEMRVTLSYFISPNPSSRVRTRYRYESFGLRFDVKGPLESRSQFRSRITKAIELDEADRVAPNNSYATNWRIGTQARHKGSIHSDVWEGTAEQLANCGLVAVYPTTGWWKTRAHLRKFDNAVNYALLVSIHAPDLEVDLYTPIEEQIAVAVENTV